MHGLSQNIYNVSLFMIKYSFPFIYLKIDDAAPVFMYFILSINALSDDVINEH